jgi:sugar O-acyltransferase (sialic acid O-acetyltransferase NeuD family)
MSAPAPIGRIEAPLVNANEPEALVVGLDVEPYSPIARRQRVCTLETSKATAEVESDYDGFVGPLGIALGGRVAAGDLICEVFAEMPQPAAEGDDPAAAGTLSGFALRGTGTRRITRKAARLAEELGVDVTGLPGAGFVTEAEVRAAAQAAAPVDIAAVRPAIHDRAVVLFGGGGMARTLIDLVRAGDDFEVIAIVDDVLEPGTDVLGVPVLGGGVHLGPLAEAGLRWAANAVGAIGRTGLRAAVSARIAAAGLRGPVLVDPTASVARSAQLADGVQVHAQATVSAAATVGAHTIVNTGAVVSHDCRVGADAHLAPGAILAGAVTVGDRALVGMGATAPVGVTIGEGAIVGNGATLRGDVPAGAVVPAGSLWPRD